jgi:hypothetical protein
MFCLLPGRARLRGHATAGSTPKRSPRGSAKAGPIEALAGGAPGWPSDRLRGHATAGSTPKRSPRGSAKAGPIEASRYSACGTWTNSVSAVTRPRAPTPKRSPGRSAKADPIEACPIDTASCRVVSLRGHATAGSTPKRSPRGSAKAGPIEATATTQPACCPGLGRMAGGGRVHLRRSDSPSRSRRGGGVGPLERSTQHTSH